MKTDIKINELGRILNGKYEVGWYVYIQDDQPNTGGYLILTFKNPDGTEGFDNWVERERLEDYIEATEWEIEWLENDSFCAARST